MYAFTDVYTHTYTCTHSEGAGIHTHTQNEGECTAFPAGGAIHTDSTEPELSLAH